MAYIYYSVRHSDLAVALKRRLAEVGIDAKVLVDPCASFYPAQCEHPDVIVAVDQVALEKSGQVVEELGLRVS